MARVDASYVEKNRNQNGFSIVHFDTQNSRCQQDQIVFADDYVNVAGTLYLRR